MNSPFKWILATVFIAGLFCVSFVYFYTKLQTEKSSPTAEIEKKRTKVLPEAKLIDLDSQILSDEKLRKGKVILIFVTSSCEACLTESKFLSDLLNKRSDIYFYGVTSYGNPKETLEIAQNKFPFKVYYDADSLLALQLKITKVPIKIYLEDGIIKKVWGGATVSEDKKSEFINWLENV